MKPFLTIKEIKEKIARKEVSPQEVLEFYKNRLSEHNKDLNCALEIFDDAQFSESANPDAPLYGIPGLIKDNICQKSRTTSAASNILKNYRAPYHATVTSRLRDAGSISIGRANMDEFAMGGSGEFSAYGPTKNPWSTECVPGGSSSGSAAAVAAGLVPYALGTETGGSVRNPAALCSLVGMYPSYGHTSRFGLLAFTSSTDQIAPLTKTVYDNALVMSVLSGHDSNDATSIQQAPQDYTKGLDGKIPKNLTIGVIKDIEEKNGLDPEIRAGFDATLEHMKKLGAKIKYVDLPHLKYGVAVYFILSRAESTSNLSRFDGSLYGARSESYDDLLTMYKNTRHDGFGPEVKRRILVGNYTLSSGHHGEYFDHANHVRGMIRAEFEAAFKDVDVLASPTTASLPFKIGTFDNDPIAMYLNDFYTVSNCIIGTPAISIPCGFSEQGLPIGVQFLGPRLSEHLLYKVAYAFEQSTDYHLRFPDGYE